MTEKRPIMIMAGGTGGHVFPALAVARYLREQGEQIVWMGTRAGIEARLVPDADFPIEWLEVQGVRGKGLATLLMAPLRIAQACWQALSILRHNRPRAVLGMGGFASGPGGLMACVLRIPLIIHEQNAVIGLTNKLLKRFSRINFFAFPEAAQGVSRSRVVGNPVREEILSIDRPSIRLQDRSQDAPLNLLVIGGSLGARRLNQVLPKAIALMPAARRPQVRHQCGERHLEDCVAGYRSAGVDAEILTFIDDMSEAYRWADLVLCRAGALTVAELAAAGMASILVPFPYAVDGHQFHNARYLSDNSAAITLRESELDAPTLARQLDEFDQDRDRIEAMSIAAHGLAYREATMQVADGILREAL